MAVERLTDEELAALWQESEEADWSNTRDTTGWHSVRLEAKQVLRLVAEVRASRELLTKLEWAHIDGTVCKICGGLDRDGHAPGCALAALLGREAKP